MRVSPLHFFTSLLSVAAIVALGAACGSNGLDVGSTEGNPVEAGAPSPEASPRGPTEASVDQPDTGSPTPCSAGAPKRLFLTQGIYSGDLKSQGGGTDGFDGADKLCLKEAKSLGICGSWKAFLGGSQGGAAVAPVDRLVDVGPWEDLSRNVAFASKAALAGPVASAGNMNIMANRMMTSASGVWVGFAKVGGTAAASCRNSDGESWTSAAAASEGHSGLPIDKKAWSDRSQFAGGGFPPTNPCSERSPIYCFEQ